MDKTTSGQDKYQRDSTASIHVTTNVYRTNFYFIFLNCLQCFYNVAVYSVSMLNFRWYRPLLPRAVLFAFLSFKVFSVFLRDMYQY